MRAKSWFPLDEDSVRALLPRFERHGTRGGRGRAAALLREPAHERRVARSCTPPSRAPHHPFERGMPRDPGVRAPVHGLRQRLRPAADVGLPHPSRGGAPRPRPRVPVAPHDLRRRAHHPRKRDPFPHSARRVGARRRRNPRYRDRPRVRQRETRSPSTWAARRPKICLIDGWEPQTTRTFEVARAYRNPQGERPAGSHPGHRDGGDRGRRGVHRGGGRDGPAQRGSGERGSRSGPRLLRPGAAVRPTVTDADVVLGRIDPAQFAGGSVRLAPERAVESIRRRGRGSPSISLDALAALSVSEMVDENMANAARVHAVEWGKDLSARTMIAFGGAAPLHAARLAQKLDVDRVIVPAGAGGRVGDRDAAGRGVLRGGAKPLPSSCRLRPRGRQRPALGDARGGADGGGGRGGGRGRRRRREGSRGTRASSRRRGTPTCATSARGTRSWCPSRSGRSRRATARTLAEAFDAEYARLYGRTIPGQEREVLSWTLTVTAGKAVATSLSASPSASPLGRGRGESDAGGRRAGLRGRAGGRRLRNDEASEPAAVRPGPCRLRTSGGSPPRAARPRRGAGGAGRDRRGSDHHRGPGRLPGTVNPFGYLVLDRVGRKGLTARGGQGKGLGPRSACPEAVGGRTS